ncbi:hypothetical protein AALP_AA8G185300 [Arabis alpina]|uniref:Uncharacterized protein n=1 Tax=Arabis alpina TaxID=50452 RepID=A0A087G7V9_ARAAL|nr:hypothetical protein AALP_AA8G185300 [Arabis alpina]
MILTLGISPVINRQPISPVNHGFVNPCKSRPPFSPLLSPPPSRSTPPENHRWDRDIAADLWLVMRILTAPRPKPPDLLFPEPGEPPPLDPPPDPSDSSLEAAHPFIASKNQHSINPSPHLHPRRDLAHPLPPWPKHQGEAIGLSKPLVLRSWSELVEKHQGATFGLSKLVTRLLLDIADDRNPPPPIHWEVVHKILEFSDDWNAPSPSPIQR